MAAGRWMVECFATTTKCKHSAHSLPRKGGHVHIFPLQTHTHTHVRAHAHTEDKLMNANCGGFLNQSGTCFTTMRISLTKTTEMCGRRREEVWGKRERLGVIKPTESEDERKTAVKTKHKIAKWNEREWALEVCALVRVRQERSWLWLDLSVHCSVKYAIFFPPSFLSFFSVCLDTFQLGYEWLCPWQAGIKAKTTCCPAATATCRTPEEQLNLWASGWTFF